MHQPGNLEVMIWDENIMHHLKQFHTLGCSRLGWPGIFDQKGEEDLVAAFLKKGVAKKADTIAELAEKMHLPQDTLVKTVKRYNQMCHQGEDTDFGKEKSRLVAVEKGPFYAITLGGNLLATLDGIRINTKMQVVDENNVPIPGLYAAGNCSGGFFWGSYPDRVPGLTASHAATFGRMAGQSIIE